MDKPGITDLGAAKVQFFEILDTLEVSQPGIADPRPADGKAPETLPARRGGKFTGRGHFFRAFTPESPARPRYPRRNLACPVDA